MHSIHTAPQAAPVSAAPAQGVWARWLFDALLLILFVGPLLSPLFRASGQPVLVETGLLAREALTLYICPTPAQSYTLYSLPMAVCARCWGATIGLWLARLLVPFSRGRAGMVGAGLRWLRGQHWLARLLLCALPFLLWPLEIIGAAQGWWLAPLWLLLFNGVLAGFMAGLFFCSVWPGFWPPARTA